MGHEERGKERHPRNPGAAAHPPFLHVCLREVPGTEPRKAAKKCTGMQRDRARSSRSGPQLPQTPKHHDPSTSSLQVVKCATCGFCCEPLWHPIKAQCVFAHSEKCEKQECVAFYFFFPLWLMFFNHAKAQQKTQGTVLHYRKINFSCVGATVCKHSFRGTIS